MNPLDFGEKLKILRAKLGISQKELAQRIHISKSAISAYESGTRCPEYGTLIKLARLFHVTTDYLLGIEHSRTLDVSDLSENEIAYLEFTINFLKSL